MMELVGFEPTLFRLSVERLNHLGHNSINRGDRIWTYDLRLIRLVFIAVRTFTKMTTYVALPNWATPRKRQGRDSNSRPPKQTALAVRRNWPTIRPCHPLSIGGSKVIDRSYKLLFHQPFKGNVCDRTRTYDLALPMQQKKNCWPAFFKADLLRALTNSATPQYKWWGRLDSNQRPAD